MKRSTLGIGMVVIIILFLGIFLFFYPPEEVKYKNFQKNGLSFKYPSDWKDYTSAVPEEDILVAIGDPDTVGFQNMSIPTTMIVIKKSVLPLNSSQSYPENYLSGNLMAQDVNTMQMLEVNANTTSSMFVDTLISSIVNLTEGKTDIQTMIHSLLFSYLNAYSSYSGMDYKVQNLTIGKIKAQEFTFEGTNGYSQEKEYARIITFESRNDTSMAFYVIMCSARGQDMESASKKFDTIIQSLNVN